uniref:Uncharacterized protein n=1 Tax=Junco hyemalis TaxID=40217 RepID=A0A8C5IA40_JUNHY
KGSGAAAWGAVGITPRCRSQLETTDLLFSPFPRAPYSPRTLCGHGCSPGRLSDGGQGGMVALTAHHRGCDRECGPSPWHQAYGRAPKNASGSQQECSSPLLLSCGITSSGEPLPRLVTVTVPDSTSTTRPARCDLPTFTCTWGCGSGVVPTPALPSSDTGVPPCPQPHLKVLHGQGPGSWQGGHGHTGQGQVVPCHRLLQ